MEINGYYSPIDQTRLINELTQGMQLARQLRTQLGSEYSTQTNQILLQQIVSSYDKALLILGCGSPAEHPRQLTPAASPSSIIESPKGGYQKARSNRHRDVKECSFKRKSASTWTKQVKMDSENGFNGAPPDDGYSWRKYGQKEILGAKYPRSYYRCTYRNAQDCWATKHVQRSDNDPTVFNITYRGDHTCNVVPWSKSAPSSTVKQESKQEQLSPEEWHQDFAMISSFVDELADGQNMDSFNSAALDCLKSESPAAFFGDFSASDSSYFSASPSDMDIFANVHQHLDGGIADVVLGATSSIFSHHH